MEGLEKLHILSELESKGVDFNSSFEDNSEYTNELYSASRKMKSSKRSVLNFFDNCCDIIKKIKENIKSYKDSLDEDSFENFYNFIDSTISNCYYYQLDEVIDEMTVKELIQVINEFNLINRIPKRVVSSRTTKINSLANEIYNAYLNGVEDEDGFSVYTFVNMYFSNCYETQLEQALKELDIDSLLTIKEHFGI